MKFLLKNIDTKGVAGLLRSDPPQLRERSFFIFTRVNALLLALAFLFSSSCSALKARRTVLGNPPTASKTTSEFEGGLSQDERGVGLDGAAGQNDGDRLGNTDAALDDRFYAILNKEKNSAVGNQDRSDLLEVLDKASPGQLQKWRDDAGSGEISSALAMRLAKRAYHLGEIEETKSLLIEARDSTWLAEDFAALSKRMSVSVSRRRVAVLLPLSGPYGKIGKAVQRGVAIAAAQFPHAKFVFIDTTGTPAGAAAAVNKAVEQGAGLLLGPVGQNESLAAARVAVTRGVPIGLFSAGPGAPDDGVFRLWTAEEELAVRAANAAVDLGFKRIAILGPREEYGEIQALAFSRAVQKRGGEIVIEHFYDPTGTELGPDVKVLLSLNAEKNPEYQAHLKKYGFKDGWKTFSPDLDFDAIFIPDTYDRAALLAAYLPFYNVEVRTGDNMNLARLRRKHGGKLPSVVQLIGGPAWHHPGLITRGGDAVDGAILVDLFSGGGGEDFSGDMAARFFESHSEKYGSAPGKTAAQAYDSTILAMETHKKTIAGGKSPQSFSDALRAAKLPDGACGPARVLADGELSSEGVVLRVQKGSFVVEGL